MKFAQALRFDAPELDSLIQKWLHTGLSDSEQREWNQLLMYDNKFRDAFSEFVKSLRDIGWIQDERLNK